MGWMTPPDPAGMEQVAQTAVAALAADVTALRAQVALLAQTLERDPALATARGPRGLSLLTLGTTPGNATLYFDAAGNLKVVGGAGTVTTLAPP